MITIHLANNETCAAATELVVVIDVMRAFTTAAFLFNAGVKQSILVSTVEEALALKQAHPEYILTGEVGGYPIPGFDYSNSPSAFDGQDLTGRTAVQRTSAGTQGVVRSVNASEILIASLVVAGATARYIQSSAWQSVTLVQTETPLDDSPEEQNRGQEDAACAELIADRLTGRQTDIPALLARVRASKSGLKFNGANPAFPAADLALATQIDRFDFVMRVERQNGLCIAYKVEI